MDSERVILGIDPGTQLLGFGIIRSAGKKVEYVDMGVLDIRREKDPYAKLRAIYDCFSEVCKSYSPTELAIESPFYGKSAQVVLKLGRAYAGLRPALYNIAPQPGQHGRCRGLPYRGDYRIPCKHLLRLPPVWEDEERQSDKVSVIKCFITTVRIVEMKNYGYLYSQQ